jgi:hypothetical protein
MIGNDVLSRAAVAIERAAIPIPVKRQNVHAALGAKCGRH